MDDVAGPLALEPRRRCCGRRRCSGSAIARRAAAYAYPSLLDAASGSRNFETVGTRFWLYLSEMWQDGDCKVGPERDLVRLPVSWPGP